MWSHEGQTRITNYLLQTRGNYLPQIARIKMIFSDMEFVTNVTNGIRVKYQLVRVKFSRINAKIHLQFVAKTAAINTLKNSNLAGVKHLTNLSPGFSRFRIMNNHYFVIQPAHKGCFRETESHIFAPK